MKRKVFYFLKFYLGFTKRESKGFLLIMPSLIVLYLIPIFYQRCINIAHEQEYKEYLLEAHDFFSNYQSLIDSSPAIVESGEAPKFNPNRVDEDFLLKLGIDKRTASNWVKYIQGGGTFKTWEDLKKVYGLQEADLNRLKDQMDFDTVPVRKEYRRPSGPALAKIPFTEADSVTLQIVPGIGSVMAGRIIKFREHLGGLHEKRQLLDVYGVEEEMVERIFEHFTFEPGISRQIDVNELTLTQLAQHPYITYPQAKVIVAYRDQHGPFQSAEDLLKIKIFTEEWLGKLKPYLEFQ